jgi:hypothetical protein
VDTVAAAALEPTAEESANAAVEKETVRAVAAIKAVTVLANIGKSFSEGASS